MKRAMFIFLIIFAFAILNYEDVTAQEELRGLEGWFYVDSSGSVYTLSGAIQKPRSFFANRCFDTYGPQGYVTTWCYGSDGWAKKGVPGPLFKRMAADAPGAAERRLRFVEEEKKEKLRIASEQAKAQLPKVILLAKLGQTKEAIDIYLSIPEEVWTPNNIPLWNDRNDLLQALKPYVQQHKDNAKSLESKGQYKEALNEYAEGLKAADDDEAKEIRKAALEIIRRNPSLSELPEDVRRHVVRGEVLVKEGNFEDAVKEYRKAIQVAPFVARLYFNTALVYGELKNYPGAIRYMNIYLQLAPDAPDARSAKDEIYKWELQMEKAGKAKGQ